MASNETTVVKIRSILSNSTQPMFGSKNEMTKRYVGQDEMGLKGAFDFLLPEKKVEELKNTKVSNKEKNNSQTPDKEGDIEAQLTKLKDWFEKGLLSKEGYDDRVELLLDKYGFK